ncbi:MAG: DMT family transporter [Firmicutes bacterium]|nr:DMT family transporter [Bacillota bacterium]
MAKRIFTNPVCVVIFAVLCNVLWGSAYPAIKIGYELFNITDNVFEKLLFAGARFTAAGLAVLTVSGISKRKFPTVKKAALPQVLAMAVIYTAAQYVFFYIGLYNTTGTNGSIVNSTQTFMAVIAAHFLYKDDRLNARKIAGSLLGFAGVLLVTAGGGSVSFKPMGEEFILIAALCFVIGSIFSKIAAQRDDAMNVTGYNLLIGGIILSAIGFIGGGRLAFTSAGAVWILAYLAFLSAAAFTIWTMLLQYNPIGKIAVFNFIIPVSGTILSAVFLKENILDPRYLISLALVCAGIVIVNMKKHRKGI